MKNKTPKPRLAWFFQMAWRDSRKNWNRLLLFVSSIILGISALVAINSFSDNLQSDIDNEAKELLGADLMISVRDKPSKDIQAIIDSLATLSIAKSKEVSFASMVINPKNNVSRLADVRALEGDFPYYGEIETKPSEAEVTFKKGQKTVVDEVIINQFKLKKGENLKVGKLTFQIEGNVLQAPGQNAIASLVAPKVYIPFRYLKQTGLIKKGSRFSYNFYFKFKKGFEVEKLQKKIALRLEKENVRYDTVETRKRTLGQVFSYLTRFFNLVAFVALLLGCVGVASAVQVYMKEKIKTVAVLRCLGLTGGQAFLIYLIQIAIMGLIGSVIGASIGSLLQVALPYVLKDFLPLEVNFSVSWSAVGQGVLTGLGVAVLFALLPLLKVRKISPLRTLRASFEENNQRDVLRFLVYILIVAFVYGFSYLQMRDALASAYFTAFLLFAFTMLWASGKVLMWLVKKFFPKSWSYIWRQSLANLYRPNNQTLILIISIGIGTGLISTLYFIQNLLLSQLAISDANNQPNMVLFDIQSAQTEKVTKTTKSFGLPVIQREPIVAMDLAQFNDKTRKELLDDTTSNRLPRDIINRRYRVTYRDSLVSNETLVEGKLQKSAKKDGKIYISVSKQHANRMGAKVGDKIVFDVQGVRLETYIGSIRKLDLSRFRTSFTFVFPRGVLEDAPQFYVLITRVNSPEESANFQRALIKDFPNISVVDISVILETAEEIIGQIAFVIQFLAFFSILTGIFVLISSVIISRYQRIQESVLLRTLGANRRQILWINALEYFFLGSLASLTGIVLALLGSWALAVYVFEVDFAPSILPVIILYFAIVGLTIFIGLFNSRGVLNRPPLEILRTEG